MRWKIGDFEFDALTGHLRGIEVVRLPRNELRVLRFLVEKFDEDYENEKITAAVWKGSEGVTSDPLYKAIQNLRDIFGGERYSYIASRPYRLVVKPELVLDDEIATSQSVTITGLAHLDPGRQGESFPRNRDFKLIVDGMIINSVAELVQGDQQTEPIRRICHASYERSLQDFAFAIVYGSKVVTSKDFRGSVTTPDQPGKELSKRLGEICEQGVYPAEISGGQLLHDEAYCEKISADIEQFARCIANPRLTHFFRDYMCREASKHFGNDSSVFQEDFDPGKYEFDTLRPYYQHRSLQSALGQPATDSLVSFLPTSPPNSGDRYALNALREFVTRNVLSLITIMWESDVFARNTNSWRLPHILRALVRQKSLYSAQTSQQEILRDMVIEHALSTALRHTRKTRTGSIVTILLNLRDDSPFKEIRQILQQEHLVFFIPDPNNEKRARQILRLINSAAESQLLDPDYLSLEQRAALRKLRTTASRDYEAELYRVFPALQPPE